MNVLLITLIFTSFGISQGVMAQSRLLEGVKRNPDEAKSICESFRKLNKENISAGSQKSIQKISCLLYTSPSPRDQRGSRMPSSA